MELTIAADVAVDLATKGDLHAHHERIERMLDKGRDGRYYTLNAATLNSVTQPGPIAMAFTPPSPPPGRQWFLQWVAVWRTNDQGGLLGGAIANLFAALCVGASPTGPGAPSARAVAVNASDIVVPAITVPASVNIPDKTRVNSQQNVYVLIGGSGLTSVQFNAAVGLIDVPDVPEALFW